jgi:hypothetical protein
VAITSKAPRYSESDENLQQLCIQMQMKWSEEGMCAMALVTGVDFLLLKSFGIVLYVKLR